MQLSNGLAEPETGKPESVQAILARYRRPDGNVSAWQLITTVLAFVVCWTTMAVALQTSYWLALVMAVPVGALIIRAFVLQHDCAHGSFFKDKRWNTWVGRALCLITLTPFAFWRRDHLVHHATSGNLERRGFGDIKMLTVAEYESRGWAGRLSYRMFRNPLFMFGLAPTFYFVLRLRMTWMVPKEWKRERASVRWTNLTLLIVYGGLAYLIGPLQLLSIQLPAIAIGGAAGVWLFYVQHNFEGTYWAHEDEWDETEASMVGSSFLRLPAILRWCTASIGYHHIHHLDRRVPNYNLQACHDGHEYLRKVTELTLWKALPMVRLKLWDEESHEMVGYSAVGASRKKATESEGTTSQG